MAFAAGLRRSLEIHGLQIAPGLSRGDALEDVLDRLLLAVERNFDGELITSILLLSPDGKRLSHGAGPKLPISYRKAIDGVQIGPCAGSCGTAAYLGRAVYVADIATDPLWLDYRHLALPHGLRACWSTPIHDEGALVGTFAVYHPTPRSPTREEVDAIGMITAHVAQAIKWSRAQGKRELRPASERTSLRLVSRGEANNDAGFTAEGRDLLRLVGTEFERIARVIQCTIDAYPDAGLEGLIRAQRAAERAAAIARKGTKPD